MIPERIYELLPAAYAVLGLLAMLASGTHNAIGLASGALLVSAAYTIYRLRRAFRKGR